MEDISRRRFLAGAGAVAVLGPLGGATQDSRFNKHGLSNTTEVIGHRGASGVYEDNSLEAINYCLDSPKTDGVEVDLRVTDDDVVVLSHDPYITGDSLMLVGSNTYDELEENSDTHLVTLREFLKLMQGNRKNMMFGIKSDKAVHKLNRLVEEFGVVERTTIMSLDVKSLEPARKDCRIFLAGGVPNHTLLRNAQESYIDAIIPYHMSGMTKQIAIDAKKQGLTFGVWFFVDTVSDVEDALLYELDYILTNNPRRTAKIVKQ